MKVEVEHYRGIEFVRISSLPEDQKKTIWGSLDTKKIIKILRDHEVLSDCIQYGDYQEWYKQFKQEPLPDHRPELITELKLVFK